MILRIDRPNRKQSAPDRRSQSPSALSYLVLGLAFGVMPFHSARSAMHRGPINGIAKHPLVRSGNDTCRATMVSQTPLRLADGRWLWVGEEDHAADRGGDVAVVSSYIEVWKKDLSSDPPLSHADSIRGLRSGYDFTNHHVEAIADSLIGAVIHDDGSVLPIPIPKQLRGRTLAAIHVAAGDNGHWRILLVARLGKGPSESPSGTAERLKEMWTGISAELWYGVFTAAGWQSLERIGTAAQAGCDFHFIPDLAVDGDDVAFAYPVLSERQERVVLLHRQAGHWQSDTLWVRTAIQGVHVLKAPGRHQWLIAVTHLQIAPPGAAALYLSEFDSSWTRETLAVAQETVRATNGAIGTTSTGISSPILLTTAAGLFASWTVSDPGQNVGSSTSIHMARVTMAADSAPLPPRLVAGDVDYLRGFSAAVVHDSDIVWIFAERAHPEEVRVVTLKRGDVFDLGLLPVHTLRGHDIVAVRNDDVLYLTAASKSTASDPPIVSLLSKISLACKASTH